MITILKKEINEFLDSLIAYVAIGIFLTGIGLLMWVFPDTNVLDYGYASMETLFSLAPYVFMFLIPAITMKAFAEEKRSGTIELLYTLPFRDIEIVIGKFLAGFLLVVFSVLPTLIYYFSLSYLGNPVGNIDTAGITGSYIGLILLGGIFTAIGILSSALTGNQIVSFILAAFLCFAFYAGFDSIASINVWLETSFIIEQIGILSHYETLSKGLIDLSDVIYFLSMIVLFLYLTKIILNVQKG
ncbi:ABC-2 type transport system permease protein [Ekhidna lutea]|uniref:ABC-2 type transport system permease protein n=1 Tax=Ekhidna lutea TaxID=447679 RepID=A0A239L5E3_EKHLU|nr:gliding motility-associated ABC transporter permease subunit GldF [Ekhidna lutea]SNT25043.1 ABC-2 type transport system permease protein [Ekhidna lutea]